MANFETNPFSVLTFIAAPAVLTNASSVLALGTSNRFARVIDRGRSLAKVIREVKDGTGAGSAAGDKETYLRMLTRNERRGELLVRALRAFYFSLGCFAAASLVCLLGAIVSGFEVVYVVRITLVLALMVGVGGVSGLVMGCIHLVRETGLAQANLREESDLVRREASV